MSAKRFREPTNVRRTWETWWYDTSKQGIGAIIIHLTNVYLAPLFQGDPCTWYVINFLLDSTIGLLIVFIGIRLCQFLAYEKKWPAINFGVYGKPELSQIADFLIHISSIILTDAPKSWRYQTCIYIGLMALVKLLTSLFIQLRFWNSVKDLVLWPFSNPTIELALIMLVIPFFVNLLIFWVTDNFLMRHDHHRKSMLINYVGNGSAARNGATGLNGKSIDDRILRKRSIGRSTNNNGNSSDSFVELMLTSDSELDQLIPGDENYDIDDMDMFVGDRIALEKFGQGIGSSNVIDHSSLSPSVVTAAAATTITPFAANRDHMT